MLKLAYPIHPAPPEKRPPGGQIFPDGAVIPLDAPQCWVARTQPDGSVSRAFEESVWDVEASDADLRADMRLALEDIQGAPLSAAYAHLCGVMVPIGNGSEWAHPTAGAWVRQWFGRDPVGTVRALQGAARVARRQGEFNAHFLSAGEPQHTQVSAVWLGLRTVLAGSSKAVYEDCLTVAREAFPSLGLSGQIGLACAFATEAEWAEVAARAFLENPPRGNGGALLLTCLRDPELAERIFTRYAGEWVWREGILSPLVPTMLSLLGEQALPWVMALARQPGKLGLKLRRDWLRWIGTFPNAETVHFLGESLADKDLVAVATQLLTGYSGEWVSEVLAKMPKHPARANLLKSRAAATQTPEEGSSEGIPLELITPPWSRPRVKRTLIEAPALPEQPVRFFWEPGDEERMVPLGEFRYGLVVDGTHIPLLKLSDEQLLEFLPVRPIFTQNAEFLLYVAFRLRERALPGLRKLTQDKHALPAVIVEVVSRVGWAELAAYVARTHANVPDLRWHTKAWLRRFPDLAALGLIPQAVSLEHSPALDQLRQLPRTTVEAAAQSYPAAVQQALQEALNADPLDEYPDKMPKLPPFWNPSLLPRPTCGGKPLPLEAVEVLARMLSISTLERPYAGVSLVKARLDADSLEAFGWALFESWLFGGAKAGGWAFWALGLLGGDECARQLAATIRGRWLREKRHTLSVTGVEVLAAIGSDVALMHLTALAHQSPVKQIKERAEQMLQQVALARDLSPEELEDRIVPAVELEILDFGPRQFKVTVDEMLAPAIWLDGQKLAQFPKRNAQDDAAKFKQAESAWKELKANLARLAPDQLGRLERACSEGRRWKLADFQTFIAHHPLLRHLAVRLIWGAYGPDGKLLLSFRVAEDSSWADAQDQLLQPPADCQVGVLHPAEISAVTLDQWRQVLLDYAVLQPFAQIERRIYSADAHLVSLPGLAQKVSHGRLFALSRRGWRKHFRDFGWVNELHKPLSDNILAVIAFEPGIAIADTRSSEPQQVTGLKLQSGTFASLGPVIGSELLKDYYELTEAL